MSCMVKLSVVDRPDQYGSDAGTSHVNPDFIVSFEQEREYRRTTEVTLGSGKVLYVKETPETIRELIFHALLHRR